MNSILAEARRLLTDAAGVRGHSLRVACWLARAALEEEVTALLRARGRDPGSASMRVRLACLEVAYGGTDPHLVRTAADTWAGLSRASHHHAFEMAPSLSEATHLAARVGMVASIRQLREEGHHRLPPHIPSAQPLL